METLMYFFSFILLQNLLRAVYLDDPKQLTKFAGMYTDHVEQVSCHSSRHKRPVSGSCMLFFTLAVESKGPAPGLRLTNMVDLRISVSLYLFQNCVGLVLKSPFFSSLLKNSGTVTISVSKRPLRKAR